MTETNERYGGTPISVGGVRYVMAPLSFGAMNRFRRTIDEILNGKVTGDDAMKAGFDVICASLRRNYPDLTPERIEEEIVDTVNFQSLFQTALEASGFKPKGKSSAESPPT
jgi:hypothetical protein